jgi:hypothetical protein
MQSTAQEHTHIEFVCYKVIYTAVCYFQTQGSIATYTAILSATPEFYSVDFTKNPGYIPIYITRSLHAKSSYLCNTNTIQQKTTML